MVLLCMVFVCVVFLSNPDLEDPEDRTVETVFSGSFSELESIPGVSHTPPPPQFCERAYGDVACLWMCVLFNFFFVCLHVCAYASKFKVHYGSAFEPGASGLPHYCTPSVCVSDVIGRLAVWQHNQ